MKNHTWWSAYIPQLLRKSNHCANSATNRSENAKTVTFELIKSRTNKSEYYTSVLDFYLDLMRACDNCHLIGPASEKQRQIIKLKDTCRSIIISVFPWFDVSQLVLFHDQFSTTKTIVNPPGGVPKSLWDHCYSAITALPETCANCIESCECLASRENIQNCPSTHLKGKNDSNLSKKHGEKSDVCTKDTRKCQFCGQKGDRPENLSGRLLYYRQNEWVHINCSLWSSEVYEEVDGSLQNVWQALNRGSKLICTKCGERGATVGCNQKFCEANFHFECGLKDGAIYKDDKKVFCVRHHDTKGNDLSISTMKDFRCERTVHIDVELESKKTGQRKTRLVDLRKTTTHIGSLTVNSIGHLKLSVSDLTNTLIPVDFECTRLYWSTLDPTSKVKYKCYISLVLPDEQESTEDRHLVVDHSILSDEQFSEQLKDFEHYVRQVNRKESENAAKEKALKLFENGETDFTILPPNNKHIKEFGCQLNYKLLLTEPKEETERFPADNEKNYNSSDHENIPFTDNAIQNLIEKEPSLNDESIGNEKQNIGISSDGSHSEIHASPSKRLNKAIGNVIKRLSPNKCDLEKNIERNYPCRDKVLTNHLLDSRIVILEDNLRAGCQSISHELMVKSDAKSNKPIICRELPSLRNDSDTNEQFLRVRKPENVATLQQKNVPHVSLGTPACENDEITYAASDSFSESTEDTDEDANLDTDIECAEIEDYVDNLKCLKTYKAEFDEDSNSDLLTYVAKEAENTRKRNKNKITESIHSNWKQIPYAHTMYTEPHEEIGDIEIVNKILGMPSTDNTTIEEKSNNTISSSEEYNTEKVFGSKMKDFEKDEVVYHSVDSLEEGGNHGSQSTEYYLSYNEKISGQIDGLDDLDVSKSLDSPESIVSIERSKHRTHNNSSGVSHPNILRSARAPSTSKRPLSTEPYTITNEPPSKTKKLIDITERDNTEKSDHFSEVKSGLVEGQNLLSEEDNSSVFSDISPRKDFSIAGLLSPNEASDPNFQHETDNVKKSDGANLPCKTTENKDRKAADSDSDDDVVYLPPTSLSDTKTRTIRENQADISRNLVPKRRHISKQSNAHKSTTMAQIQSMAQVPSSRHRTESFIQQLPAASNKATVVDSSYRITDGRSLQYLTSANNFQHLSPLPSTVLYPHGTPAAAMVSNTSHAHITQSLPHVPQLTGYIAPQGVIPQFPPGAAANYFNIGTSPLIPAANIVHHHINYPPSPLPGPILAPAGALLYGTPGSLSQPSYIISSGHPAYANPTPSSTAVSGINTALQSAQQVQFVNAQQSFSSTTSSLNTFNTNDNTGTNPAYRKNYTPILSQTGDQICDKKIARVQPQPSSNGTKDANYSNSDLQHTNNHPNNHTPDPIGALRNIASQHLASQKRHVTAPQKNAEYIVSGTQPDNTKSKLPANHNKNDDQIYRCKYSLNTTVPRNRDIITNAASFPDFQRQAQNHQRSVGTQAKIGAPVKVISPRPWKESNESSQGKPPVKQTYENSPKPSLIGNMLGEKISNDPIRAFSKILYSKSVNPQRTRENESGTSSSRSSSVDISRGSSPKRPGSETITSPFAITNQRHIDQDCSMPSSSSTSRCPSIVSTSEVEKEPEPSSLLSKWTMGQALTSQQGNSFQKNTHDYQKTELRHMEDENMSLAIDDWSLTSKSSNSDSIKIVLQQGSEEAQYRIQNVSIKDGSQMPFRIDPKTAIQAIAKARSNKRASSKKQLAMCVNLDGSGNLAHTEEDFANEQIIDEAGQSIAESLVAEAKDSYWRSKATSKCESTPQMLESRSPYLMYHISSEDGFKAESSDPSHLWKLVYEAVQKARVQYSLRSLPDNPSIQNGFQMLGLSHAALAYLIEQLPGAMLTKNYKFRHQRDADRNKTDTTDQCGSSLGCNRTQIFKDRKPCDIPHLSWLANPHRKFPDQCKPTENGQDWYLADTDQGGSSGQAVQMSKRATSLDLPMAMRFRHLAKNAKEAVGVFSSLIHGRGLYCKRTISAGEMVIEYAGEEIRAILTDKRERM